MSFGSCHRNLIVTPLSSSFGENASTAKSKVVESESEEEEEEAEKQFQQQLKEEEMKEYETLNTSQTPTTIWDAIAGTYPDAFLWTGTLRLYIL